MLNEKMDSKVFEKGDIVRFRRGLTTHYGIFDGQEGVYTLKTTAWWSGFVTLKAFSGSDETNPKTKGLPTDETKIKKEPLKSILNTCHTVNDYDTKARDGPYKPDGILQRVVQETRHPVFENSEQFVTWCRYGEKVQNDVLGRMEFNRIQFSYQPALYGAIFGLVATAAVIKKNGSLFLRRLARPVGIGTGTCVGSTFAVIYAKRPGQ